MASFWRRTIWIAIILVGVAGCRPPAPPPAPPSTVTPEDTSTSSAPRPTAKPTTVTPSPAVAATVETIIAQPVWVKLAPTPTETSAQVGDRLAPGDTIRTTDKALAEVALPSGLAFRIGGDASLTLQADNQLQLNQGEMLTWVPPDKDIPTQVITPAGIAGLRGTTLFIRIPPGEDPEIEFFAWEGTITIHPTGASEDLILRSGEQLLLRRGDRDIPRLRQRIRRLPRRVILQRRRQSRLLNDFPRPLPTLREIEATLEESPP